MDIPLENISGKVGINGAPLKKLSSAEKKELKIILKNLYEATHNIPDEMLLRVYLLAGEKPISKIKLAKIIVSALNVKDILKNMKKLTEEIIFINGEDLFQAINESLKKSSNLKLDLKVIKYIITNIQKWQKMVVKSQGRLTDKTEGNIITVIKQIAWTIPNPKSLNDKIIKKYRTLIFPLFEILFAVAVKSNSYETYKLSVETIKTITNKFPSLIINDILADDRLSKNIDTFKEKVLEKSECCILNGNVEQFVELYKIVDETLSMKFAFIKNLQSIWNSQGATL